MSTQPNTLPSWKQEVNQRLAAHKNRKGATPAVDTRETVQGGASSRAAEAAARVAARYAKAPSYSEMQAAETRVVVRAAEIATQVALQAQATAETALAEMHAAVIEQPSRGPAVVETFAPPVRKQVQRTVAEPVRVSQPPVEVTRHVLAELEPVQPPAATIAQPDLFFTPSLPEGQSFGIRWEPDMPTRPAERKPASSRRQEEFELSAEDWWTPADARATQRSGPIEVDAQSTHANLIEFPRELVATRKIRPRMAEVASGALDEAEGQLSIFEVDPQGASQEAMQQYGASELSGAEWSGIELDAQPAEDRAPSRDAIRAAEGPFLASLGLRTLATVVDGALIAAAFFGAAFVAMSNMQHPPVVKAAEQMGAAGIVLTGLVYYAFFFTLAICTPGMKYAGIGLCTFDNASPNRAQLRRRLGAMVLSLLPVGLGIVWAVFDEDHLSWHDRISQTYLRKV